MPNIHAIIDQIPLFEYTLISAIEPLNGGLTNSSYLIHAECRRYVLRLSGPHATELGIDRRIEQQVLERVTAAGIAPEVLWYNAETGDNLTRFIDGHEFTMPEFSEVNVIERVAPLLRKLHNLPAIEGAFSPYRQIEDRLVSAQARCVDLPENLDALLDKLHSIEAERASVTPVLCHGDPFHNNFIDVQGRLYLIDWEFAGMCDPMFDLVAATYFCTPERRDVMLKAYYGEVRDSDRSAMHQLWYVVAFWNATWAMLQDANARAEFDYAGMATNVFRQLTERY